jgi:hypothetical protein
MKTIVSRSAAERNPNLVWNSFVASLASSDFEGLNANQRKAHLVFHYESEVQNGGHLQFFENRPASLIDQTVLALASLGATQHSKVLKAAAVLWRSHSRGSPRSVKEYVKAASQEEFRELNQTFYGLNPTITEALEKYLDANIDTFIQFES